MKLSLTVAASLLHVLSSEALTTEGTLPAARIHPRTFIKRADGRDCGKFTMFCEKAAGACNNACYHIKCVDKGTSTMVYEHTTRQLTAYLR